MSLIIIDIETGKSPDADLFEPKFAPDARLKDAEKIKWDLLVKTSKWKSECALNALTGEVLAVGIYNPKLWSVLYLENEIDNIKCFWNDFGNILKDGHTIVGHNIKQFDLPFLWRRSIKHGIEPLWKPQDRYNEQIVDTMDLWNCGKYPKELISLDNLAKFLGVGSKNGEGKDFAKLFNNPDTRQQALDYLTNDLEITFKVAQKLIIE